ncbi:helix-turn-helix transcriptional regulator [Demequina capsici]|uniref:Transcriptional regulator n=1 Tax=Demequina capsici TaxID=3075620 RepID=A0AA96F7S2_9MICO|nr:transcriptional regulator [Demequina sp. OYTSA14]WNM23240.1 transcriptional regulator [Demequina sp. OYTSA14]
MHADTTRDRVLSLIVTAGPITAASLASELSLTAAGVRRHLSTLIDDRLIVDHEQPGPNVRGRGRPARSFVATNHGQESLASDSSAVAVDAVRFMRDHGDLEAFVESKASELESAIAPTVPAGAPMPQRVEAVAAALGVRGYATSVRPGPGGYTLQLCQGHCPVQEIATEAPEWCEAETRAISRLLDVHVQRLSTLAGGAHVCTTTIPVAPAATKEG